MKRMSLPLLLAASVMVIAGTGCLKDKGYDNQDYGLNVGDTKAVSIPQSPSSPVAHSIDAVNTLQTIDAPDVELEAPRAVNSNTTVKLQVNNAILPSGVTALPAGKYTIPSLDVVIPAGQTKAHFVINIPDATSLDPTLLYGLGFQIVSVDNGFSIASNMKSVVVTISIKNRFDGVYSVRAYVNMGTTNTTAPYLVNVPCGNALEVELATSGPNSVVMSHQPVYRGGSQIYFDGLYPIDVQFNAANEVIDVNNLGSLAGSFPYVFPDATAPYSSRYDPATKTIYMRYRINNGGTWWAIDTLTFCRPR